MTNTHSNRSLVTGMIASALMLAAAVVVIVGGMPGGPHLAWPWQHSMKINAELSSVDTLAPNATVDVAGVKVGTVQSISWQGKVATVTMLIDDPNGASIRTDASVQLRPHGLFGPQYIEIAPGKAPQTLADDGTILVNRSQQPVDLDQVLSALQAPEQANLRTTLVELGAASASRGDDVHSLITAANSLSATLQTPLKSVDSVAPNLSDLIVQNQAFNADFAQTPLDQLVANSNITLQAVAANSAHLQNVLTEADAVFGHLNADLNGQSGHIRTILAQAPTVLKQLDTFNGDLALFAQNLQGLDTSLPQDKNVTSGIIAAIDNPKSAFSSYDCTVQQSPCPQQDRQYYLRVQVFNLAGIGNTLNTNQFSLCSLPILTLPGTPQLTNCPSGQGNSGAVSGSAPVGLGPQISSLASFLSS